MNNENIIHSLESIPEPTIYSKYGSSLKRSFKSRSLKNFIYELKNPKKLVQKDDDESFRKKNILMMIILIYSQITTRAPKKRIMKKKIKKV